MSLLEVMLSRKSHNLLVSPGPSKEQVKVLMQAALRAPDHGQLKPWRYLIYSGDSLAVLGEHFVSASLHANPDMSEQKIDKSRKKPLRAPMVIVAIVKLIEHRKIPEVEQLLSAGAGVQNLIMAAHFMDIGAMWRTGDLAYSRKLMSLLGLEKNESIIGFIYLGTEDGIKRTVPKIDQSDFVKWRNT